MSIDDDVALLERVPTLRLLGRESLRMLAIGSEARDVPRGDFLFQQGDDADSGFVVQRGAFRIDDGAGAEMSAGPGTLLGELALVTETKRPVTATAIEPSTVMRVSRGLFRKVLEGFPDAARLMRDRVAERASEATDELQAVRDMLLPKPPRQ